MVGMGKLVIHASCFHFMICGHYLRQLLLNLLSLLLQASVCLLEEAYFVWRGHSFCHGKPFL